MATDLGRHYLEEALRQFQGQKRFGELALNQLRDGDFFAALDSESNSIAILVKHLAGNMRSRFTDFLTADGEKPDRHRDQEFEVSAATTRQEVMGWWEVGWRCVLGAIGSLQSDDVMRTVVIRGESHTVLQAVNRQIAHYALHIGQIIFLAKHLRAAEWKTLTIPRGKSTEFNAGPSVKFERGVPVEK